MSCNCCYKVTLLECPENILIECGLTPNTIYYLSVTDKFTNEYVRAYQADGNGNITISASDYAQGLFMSFSGDFTIKIYASEVDVSAGENELQLSLCGNNYTCIVVSFSSDTSYAAAIPDCNQPQTPIADDELPSVTPSTFCESVDSCMKVPTANGNYVLKILNGVKSWVTATAGATWGSITGTLSNQTDLQNALNAKANSNHTHSISDVTGLATALSDAETNAKAYADQLVVGLLDDRGNYNASGNTFPNTGGSGAGGAILKGDLWTVSVAGTLGGVAVTPGDLVRALVDAPGQTASNWAVSETNFGYAAENAANKATTMTGNTASNIVYLTAKAVYDWASATFQAILTAANFGSFLNALTDKTTPADNDVVVLMDSADSNTAKKITWANIKAAFLNYFSGIFSRRIIYDISHNSVTGTSAETILMSKLIPANTFAVNDGFSYYVMLDKSAQTASDTWNISIYLNATNDLSGTPRLIGNSGALAANNRWYSQGRDLNTFTAAATIEYFTTGLGLGSDSTSAGVNIAAAPYLSNNCPNIGGDMYFIVTARHTGASQADTITHRKTVLYLEKA